MVHQRRFPPAFTSPYDGTATRTRQVHRRGTGAGHLLMLISTARNLSGGVDGTHHAACGPHHPHRWLAPLLAPRHAPGSLLGRFASYYRIPSLSVKASMHHLMQAGKSARGHCLGGRHFVACSSPPDILQWNQQSSTCRDGPVWKRETMPMPRQQAPHKCAP